ncbi:abnormal spindle-like microcephaly-associated protein homolog isoform X3 [Biomphalaria glabrata]|uniref:Abnormal spindle-like microcephaly-associated protein homolog isoform X3 n=1 Tax=Biomphalaria glabrata TaxID=6526 RepID=A0A9W2Z7I8_BIOGL|nr:abnormal spindle-like microcephaly-associated protein homolog isoform X3 [Biomphalaria glabrata]
MSTSPLLTLEQDSYETMDQGGPIWRSSPHKGIHLRLFKNGERYYPGKLVTLNKKQFRTFESWLSELSRSMKLNNGAIWRVYTPRHGTRKLDLEDLRDGDSLVLAGQESFKKLSYEQIAPTDKRKSPPFKYDAEPVLHNRMYLNSGKIHKIDTHATLIKVWPNGGDLRGPRRVLLTPRVRPFTLENVLSQVNDMLKEDCLGTVEKLYLLTGIKVSDVDQIVPNGQYVACRKTERFKRAKYNDQGVKNLATSPRLERKFLAPLHPRSNNSTNQSTPEHSNESTQNSVHSYPYRQKLLAKEENVFPAKPVKYQRAPEKTDTNVDYDTDHGGVFKAKQSNKTTKDAKEIPDSRHTKTDYPIDRQKAEEVEDEFIPPRNTKKAKEETLTKKGDNYRAAQTNSSSKKSNQQEEEIKSATKIQSGYRGYKARQEMVDKSKKSAPKNSAPLTDHFDEEERAAAKIQAGFRGYQTRKNLDKFKDKDYEKGKQPKEDNTSKKQPKENSTPRKQPKEDSTPRKVVKPKEATKAEKDAAAAKIQASYRGYRSRQDLQRHKEEESALRIQSGYRGYQTRKQLSDANEKMKETKPKGDSQKEKNPKQVPKKNQDEDMWDQEEWAATKIQSAYRGYTARKTLERSDLHGKSTSRNEDAAAAKIQASYRSHLQRKSLREKNKVDQHAREMAAFKIQSSYRGYRSHQDRLKKNNAALKIQASYRGYQTRKLNSHSQKKSMELSARKIQAAYRGYLYRRQSQTKHINEEDEIKAAKKIQATYRGHQTRQYVSQKNKKDMAASKIQSAYRGYQNRKHLKAGSTADRINASVKIQAGYRGYKGREHLAHQEQIKAAVKIQSSYRAHQARKSIKQKERNAIKIQATYRGYLSRKQVNVKKRNAAAVKIQSGYRSFKTRKQLTNQKELQAKNIIQQEKAASLIQASYRGYVSRKIQKSAIHEKSQKEAAARLIQLQYRHYRSQKN